MEPTTVNKCPLGMVSSAIIHVVQVNVRVLEFPVPLSFVCVYYTITFPSSQSLSCVIIVGEKNKLLDAGQESGWLQVQLIQGLQRSLGQGHSVNAQFHGTCSWLGL